MLKIERFRSCLDYAASCAWTASEELSALRHDPRVDEQYKLDRTDMSDGDMDDLMRAAGELGATLAQLQQRMVRR